MAIPAVDIEHDTGEPVAKLLSAAIRVYTKPAKPQPYVSPQQFIREMQFWAGSTRYCPRSARRTVRQLTAGRNENHRREARLIDCCSRDLPTRVGRLLVRLG